MSAKTETLYRDAPFIDLERLDEASVPDCGSAAIARLRAENDRRERLLWALTTALWLALSTCILGIATFRQAPFIIVGGFIAARDVMFILLISRDRAGLAQRAIEEIVRLQGADRIAREARLRESVAAWNAEAEAYVHRRAWIGSRPSPRAARRLRHDAMRLADRRQFLVAEIGALRSSGHAAA